MSHYTYERKNRLKYRLHSDILVKSIRVIEGSGISALRGEHVHSKWLTLRKDESFEYLNRRQIKIQSVSKRHLENWGGASG